MASRFAARSPKTVVRSAATKLRWTLRSVAGRAGCTASDLEVGGRTWKVDPKPKPPSAMVGGTPTASCAEGPRIRSWVNGVPVADYLDADRVEGVIALQVHSGSCDIEWKNLSITDRGRHEWRAMDFTKDFAPRGGGTWTVQPQQARGTQVRSSPEYGLLFSTKPWGDFVLSVDCEWTAGNSGVYFREGRGFSGITGIQCEVDGVPGDGRRGFTNQRSRLGASHVRRRVATRLQAGPQPLEIHCVGDLVAVDFNGQRALQCVTRRWAPKGTLPFSCTVRRMSIWCSRTRRCWSKRRPGRLERINRPLAAKLLFHDQHGIVKSDRKSGAMREGSCRSLPRSWPVRGPTFE